MQMSEEEICRKYKENRGKKGYTNILAQLNDCSKQDINNILRKNGIDLPGNPNFQKSREEDKNMEKMKIPEYVRMQLLEDVDKIQEEIDKTEERINELRERSDEITKFLESNE